MTCNLCRSRCRSPARSRAGNYKACAEGRVIIKTSSGRSCSKREQDKEKKAVFSTQDSAHRSGRSPGSKFIYTGITAMYL